MATNKIQIEAKLREQTGRKAKHVRFDGSIPAILYGHKISNVSVAIDAKSFVKILPELSSSTLLNLNIDGDSRAVLVSEVQRDPMTGKPIHIDFHQVNLKEEIETTVPLVFEGVSLAVKDMAGMLVKSINEINVQALPQDLPEHIVVDIGALNNFDARITIADLKIGDNVKVLDNMEEIVAVVTPPRSEAEMEELNKEVEENASEVKTEAEEKKAAKEAEVVEEGAPEADKSEKLNKKETKKE